MWMLFFSASHALFSSARAKKFIFPRSFNHMGVKSTGTITINFVRGNKEVSHARTWTAVMLGA